MKRIVSATTVLVILLTLFAGCKAAEEATNEQEPAQVTVHNPSVLDLTIYAYRRTERIRLGTVTAGQEGTFELAGYIVFNAPVIQFVADPIGSPRRFLIEERTVFPGDEVNLFIPITAR